MRLLTQRRDRFIIGNVILYSQKSHIRWCIVSSLRVSERSSVVEDSSDNDASNHEEPVCQWYIYLVMDNFAREFECNSRKVAKMHSLRQNLEGSRDHCLRGDYSCQNGQNQTRPKYTRWQSWTKVSSVSVASFSIHHDSLKKNGLAKLSGMTEMLAAWPRYVSNKHG